MAHTAKTKKILALVKAETAPTPAANPAIKPPVKEAVPQLFVKSDTGTQIVNIAFLLINDELAAVMDRFRCCTCDECAAKVTEYALHDIPQVFVTAKSKADEDKVNRTAAAHREQALRAITKAVIAVKTNPPHTERG